jgi:hypothetical protein
VEFDGIVTRSRRGDGRDAPSGDDISCVNRDGIVREIVNSFEGGEVLEVWSNFVVRFEAVFKVVVDKV